MDDRRSLRELFAELSRPGSPDPAELLRAAGYGDVPGALLTEAVLSYAGTAPLEVAEHLAPFVVAHGPVPAPDADTAPTSTPDGLSLLTTAPRVDAPRGDLPAVDPDDGRLDGHVDVDPSGLDDGSGSGGARGDDVDPAAVDGLDAPHPGPAAADPHPALGTFGGGHDTEPPVRPHDQDADGHRVDPADTPVEPDHVHDLDDPAGARPFLDHDARHDPAELLDRDDPHDL